MCRTASKSNHQPAASPIFSTVIPGIWIYSPTDRPAAIITSVISSGLRSYIRIAIVDRREAKKKKKNNGTINVDFAAIGGSWKRNRVRITSAGLPYPTAIGRRNAGFLPWTARSRNTGVDSSHSFAPASLFSSLASCLLGTPRWKTCDCFAFKLKLELSTA